MKNSLNVDKLGIITSGLCAVHCLAIPFLLYSGIWQEAIADDLHGSIEWIIYGVAIVLASLALRRGYMTHKNLQPALFFAIGCLVVLSGLILHDHHYDHWIMGFGGLLLVAGHYQNHQLTYHNVVKGSVA